MKRIDGLSKKPLQEELSRSLRRVKAVVFDFDGVFTDNRVFVLQDGTEGVWCNRADGLGVRMIQDVGIQAFVLSQESNPVVATRCKKLKIRCIQDCQNKLRVLEKEARKLGISLSHFAYLGNDVNDLECLNNVGFPACVADAHPAVIPAVLYVTKCTGGSGAVREFCDLIAGEIRNGDS